MLDVVKYFQEADQLIILSKDGTIQNQGLPLEILPILEIESHSSNIDGEKSLTSPSTQELSSILDVDDGTTDEARSFQEPQYERTKTRDQQQEQQQKVDSAEKQLKSDLSRAAGDVKLYTYYLKSIGWMNTGALTATIAIFAVFLKFPTVWVKWWSAAEEQHPGKDTTQNASIYVVLSLICLAFFFIAVNIAFMRALPRSSIDLHTKLLKATTQAPYWFFVVTEESQIINHFSQDMSLISYQLPISLVDTWYNAAVSLVGAVLILISSSWAPALLPIIGVCLYILQKFYLRTSRQMRLLDLEAKAPLYGEFMETLRGLVSIRAFRWQIASTTRFTKLLNQSQKPFYGLWSIQRWLNFVLDMLVATVATIIVALATQLPGSSSASGIGVALINILTFSQDLSALIRTWTDLETSLGAVARIRDFEQHTPNENKLLESEDPPCNWPSKGGISFQDMCASYR